MPSPRRMRGDLGLPGFNGLKLSPGPGRAWAATPSPTTKRKPTSSISPTETLPSRGCWSGRLFRMLCPAIRQTILSPPRSATTSSISPATHAHPPEQHCGQVRHLGDPATAKEVEISYVQKGQAVHRKGRALHPCLLARGHSLSHQRIAAGAESGAALSRESSYCLHQCGDQELAELR